MIALTDLSEERIIGTGLLAGVQSCNVNAKHHRCFE